MPIPLQHSEIQRAGARAAYETLEPFHVVAYFAPGLRDASKAAGLSWPALYVGARGGALGATPAEVVTSCFYNFSPAVIHSGWEAALEHGLPDVMAVREHVVDQTLREALGERVEDPELGRLAEELRAIVDRQDFLGRPLAAAWNTLPWPEPPHLALWHAISILREWRGDAHIGVLVSAGLDGTEAVVFHEATHPDASLRKRVMGRSAAMKTRGWDDQAWGAAAQRLVDRGLLTLGEDQEFLTTGGGQLYDAIEVATDDAAVWRDVDDASALVQRARPFVKEVIDAGFLPGTGKR